MLVTGCSSTQNIDLKNYTKTHQFVLDGKGQAFKILKSGDLAYVSDRAGFRVFRIAADGDASQLSVWQAEPQVPADQQPMALKGNVLAVAHGIRVSMVDVSDPTAPKKLKVIELLQGVVDMAWEGDWLYLSGENLRRVNVKDPSVPGEAYPIAAQNTGALIIRDGIIYVTMNGMLQLLQLPNDAIDHAASQPLGSISEPAAGEFLFNGANTLYGSTGSSGQFFVVDVSDPMAPKDIPNTLGLSDGPGTGMVLNGTQLISASRSDFTYTYDVSAPQAPVEKDGRLMARGFDKIPNNDIELFGEVMVLATDLGLLVLAPTLK